MNKGMVTLALSIISFSAFATVKGGQSESQKVWTSDDSFIIEGDGIKSYISAVTTAAKEAHLHCGKVSGHRPKEMPRFMHRDSFLGGLIEAGGIIPIDSWSGISLDEADSVEVINSKESPRLVFLIKEWGDGATVVIGMDKITVLTSADQKSVLSMTAVHFNKQLVTSGKLTNPAGSQGFVPDFTYVCGGGNRNDAYGK